MVLLLLAVMWIGAGIYYFRGRPESRSADSIGSFRRQLRVLERTSPMVIDPAHRMRDGAPGLLLAPIYPPATFRQQMAQTPSMVALRRRRTMKRRRDIFFGLILGVVGSLVLGVLPGLHVMWLLAAFLTVMLAGYVALLVVLRGQATERATKVRYLPTASSPEPALLLRRSAN
ncbi:MAG TPA: hypothetical protein VNY84_09095 [Acidimicrobiales bacterium]|nr:hypothetical protein [Acidimicrobiales bacterium]